MKENMIIIQRLRVFFSLHADHDTFNLHETKNICIEKLAERDKMVDPQIARFGKFLKQ